MSATDKTNLERKIRIAVWVTIIGLVLNGLTAFPLYKELNFVLGFHSILPDSIYNWLVQVRDAVCETKQRYPFMMYGYDWLGFAHILIAIAFIGVLRDPIKNEWVVQFGMIASFLSILMALFFERVRGIPFTWSLVDVFVGTVAFIILWFCNRWIAAWKKV